jgi:sugar lactone lactonase YvrE
VVGNLHFSDIDNNRLHKLAPTGGLTNFHAPSNHANGPTLDLDGGLLVCEQEAQRLVKMGGSIYMTDPRYQHPLKKWNCYDSGEKIIQHIYQEAISMHKDLNLGG